MIWEKPCISAKFNSIDVEKLALLGDWPWSGQSATWAGQGGDHWSGQSGKWTGQN